MSLDPKYANLPWIAHGQPDFYEAGDLPESDQKEKMMSEDVVSSREIENISLLTVNARERFAGCYVDASKTDFSDVITGTCKFGYAVDRNEYELLPDGKNDETLMQRFQRLQAEIRQLVDDASCLVAQSKPDVDQPVTGAQLTQLAEALKLQVAELQLEKVMGEDAELEVNGLTPIVKNRILTKIASFNEDKKMSKTKNENDSIVYEMRNIPDRTKAANVEKLSELDRRLQRIEALIGRPDPARLSALTADTAHHGLAEAAVRLSARSSLLQPAHLDYVEARLASLQVKLQSITEKRETIADADTQNKIAELFELVKKWNGVCENLPSIVDRLSTMKDLHEQAAGFSRALTMLEVGQGDIDKQLKAYDDLLEQMRTNMKENMETIKNNLSCLEERIKA